MKTQKAFLMLILTTFSSIVFCQHKAEIIPLAEKEAYEYKNYYEDGTLKSSVGFYAKNPFRSVEEFEEKLKDYKIKYHGERRGYYPNGQLKEIVVYKKGEVIEAAKNYFEDGEQCIIVIDTPPKFQFKLEEQDIWFGQQRQKIATKYGVKLEGTFIFTLGFGKTGEIKELEIRRIPNEEHASYYIEIAHQVKVIEPAIKDGQYTGTRFTFRVVFE